MCGLHICILNNVCVYMYYRDIDILVIYIYIKKKLFFLLIYSYEKTITCIY